MACVRTCARFYGRWATSTSACSPSTCTITVISSSSAVKITRRPMTLSWSTCAMVVVRSSRRRLVISPSSSSWLPQLLNTRHPFLIPHVTSLLIPLIHVHDHVESDGYPGLSILAELERLNIAYTGADTHFYRITTSKPELKRRLQLDHVPTSPFVEIVPGVTTEHEVDALGGYPLIVKPSISYASISITDKR